MTDSAPTAKPARAPVLAILLYIAAVLIFLAALGYGLSIIYNTPNIFFAARLLLQGEVFEGLFNRLISIFNAVGIGLIALGALLSGALVGLAQLVRQNARLSARVKELEAALVEQGLLLKG